MVGVNVEPKPNPLAIEVLCYMAYETVAQVSSSMIGKVFRSLTVRACEPTLQTRKLDDVGLVSLASKGRREPAFQHLAGMLES